MTSLPVVFIHGRPWGRDEGLRRQEQKVLWIAGLWHGLDQAGFGEIPLSKMLVADYVDVLEEHAAKVHREEVRALVDQMERDMEEARTTSVGTTAADAPPGTLCTHCWPRGALSQKTASRWLSQATGRPAASRLLLVFPDIAAYLIDKSFRTEVTKIVMDTIAEAGPCVVVAHSLGALAAMHALATNGRGGVRALVTVGSPIALPALREDVGRVVRKSAHSLSGLAWLNAVNPYDGVTGGFLAMPPDFPPGVNNLVVANRGEPHNVGRYLSHPPVGAFIGSHVEAATTRRPATPRAGPSESG